MDQIFRGAGVQIPETPAKDAALSILELLERRHGRGGATAAANPHNPAALPYIETIRVSSTELTEVDFTELLGKPATAGHIISSRAAEMRLSTPAAGQLFSNFYPLNASVRFDIDGVMIERVEFKTETYADITLFLQ